MGPTTFSAWAMARAVVSTVAVVPAIILALVNRDPVDRAINTALFAAALAGVRLRPWPVLCMVGMICILSAIGYHQGSSNLNVLIWSVAGAAVGLSLGYVLHLLERGPSRARRGGKGQDA